MKLKDQVAIVTGAGRNIGEEIAKLFAAEGAKVAIVDIDKARGERVTNAIKAAGGDATLFIADVSKGSDVAALVKDVVARYGRIDILVNNVAISDNKHIFDISEEEWDRVLAVTLKSQFLMAKHVGQQMARAGRRRPHRQYRLDLGLHGTQPRHRLFGRQGRRRQPHPRHGGAARSAQDQGQRHRAEQDRLAGRQGRVRSLAPGAEHGKAAGRARPRRRRRCCSW